MHCVLFSEALLFGEDKSQLTGSKHLFSAVQVEWNRCFKYQNLSFYSCQISAEDHRIYPANSFSNISPHILYILPPALGINANSFRSQLDIVDVKETEPQGDQRSERDLHVHLDEMMYFR